MKLEWREDLANRPMLVDVDTGGFIANAVEGFSWTGRPWGGHLSFSGRGGLEAMSFHSHESREAVLDKMICILAGNIEYLQAIKRELEAEYQRCLK